ncbi:DUF6894 family protein [Rhizobium sp. PL01]|uniref:DUF6894 family protein n=1 Tax=Rhizobium sp. PL01 TaxID=3085631 RepID=UPI0029825D64|nr:hypothetical protein [Rhizobium sp. PL01]
MPKYFFTMVDNEGTTHSEGALDFENHQVAEAEAIKALAGMANDDLPGYPLYLLSVEVFDEFKQPIVEVRLLLEVIRK